RRVNLTQECAAGTTPGRDELGTALEYSLVQPRQPSAGCEDILKELKMIGLPMKN
ncbi:MAG: hypothetical protein RL059_872, partial [Bacteroidota bacterium]